jgi:hypothetical protein
MLAKYDFNKKFNFKAENNVPAGKLSEKILKKNIFWHP